MKKWLVETLKKFKAMPGPEQMMIGTSFAAFVIAALISVWSGIDGLAHL